MNSNRKVAIIVGVLYIIGTVTGVLSVGLVGPIWNAQDYLPSVSANQNQVIAGALFVLAMGLSLAMIPVLMFPILKEHSEVLAVGYVVFRGALETFTTIATAISWLLLIRLSQAYVQAGSLGTSSFQALGTLLQAGDVNSIGSIIFPLGALMFYYLLFKSRLIPRWISGWGLIAIIPYLAQSLLVIFGLIKSSSTIEIGYLPMFVQEMVMAVWLIVKGFNPSVIASKSPQVDS
jgi:hypothetical protein